MKVIDYVCNMCKSKTPREEITGFYYQGSVRGNKYRLDKSKIDDCDNHICQDCIRCVQGIIINELDTP